jgi:hypothetical protein
MLHVHFHFSFFQTLLVTAGLMPILGSSSARIRLDMSQNMFPLQEKARNRMGFSIRKVGEF